ncbi:MAG: hypothetical protein AAF368_00075 [Planctomycetota bacterium]
MSQLPLMPGVAPEYDEELAQWFTPPKLAARIAYEYLTPITPRFVLEPTAGGGALVADALSCGSSVIAVERDPRWAHRLRERFLGRDAPSIVCDLRVVEADYLSFDLSTIDKGSPTVLMNPPDDRNNGIYVADFLEKAMLDAGRSGEVVALVRANCLLGGERFQRVWRHAWIKNINYLTKRPRYSGASGGGEQEWCVIRYVLAPKRWNFPRRQAVVNWWTEAWN